MQTVNKPCFDFIVIQLLFRTQDSCPGTIPEKVMDIDYRKFIEGTLFYYLVVFIVTPAQPVFAQADEELVIEEIITIGSRS